MATTQILTPHSPVKWGRFFLIGAIALAAVYVGSYLDLRLRLEIVHRRTYSGGAVYHTVDPDPLDAPFIFAATAIAGQTDRIDIILADLEQRRRSLALFYWPLCRGEEMVWKVLD